MDRYCLTEDDDWVYQRIGSSSLGAQGMRAVIVICSLLPEAHSSGFENRNVFDSLRGNFICFLFSHTWILRGSMDVQRGRGRGTDDERP